MLLKRIKSIQAIAKLMEHASTINASMEKLRFDIFPSCFTRIFKLSELKQIKARVRLEDTYSDSIVICIDHLDLCL